MFNLIAHITKTGTARQKIVVGGLFSAAMFLSLLDTTVVNVALPSMLAQFRTSGGMVKMVSIGYLISLAICMPVSGWLADRYGAKPVFLLAMGLFSLSSGFCGFSSNLTELVCFRFLQGIGAGVMTPVATATLYRTFPPEERVLATRILQIPIVLAPLLGPLIGGYLTGTYSWRAIFYVNVPVGTLAAAAAWGMLNDHKEPQAGRFNVFAFSLSVAGFTLGALALALGPQMYVDSTLRLLMVLLSVMFLGLLVRNQLRDDHPMLDFRLFGDPLFRATNIVSAFAHASFFGMLFVLPIFIQVGRGASPLASGLTTFSDAAGVLVTTQICGKLYVRMGANRLIKIGLLGLSIGASFLGLSNFGTPMVALMSALFASGASMGLLFLPLQMAAYASIPKPKLGRATALFGTQRQLACAAGVAIVSSILTVGSGHVSIGSVRGAPELIGYRLAFLIAGAIAFIGFLLTVFLFPQELSAAQESEVDVVEISP